MAESREFITRRAVLSFGRLKELTNWPDLLINDYQGILQDASFIAGEVDGLDVIILENKGAITELQNSQHPNVSAQVQFLQQQINGLPEFTIDTTGFTTDLTTITTDKVIA